MKFKDGAYCGCNLFGFLNPRAHRAAQFWRQIEQERKKPLKMMRILGWAGCGAVFNGPNFIRPGPGTNFT